MRWNWQRPDWPNFVWTSARFVQAEDQFLVQAGTFLGAVKHLNEADVAQLNVEGMSDEAITTSGIEGQILDRDSVQSSIRRQLGLTSDGRRVQPAEQGVSELVVDVFRHYDRPLSESVLCDWHRMVCRGRTDLRDVGRYRTHPEPIQVVSGRVYEPKVHFEAPPSVRVRLEMERYIDWFNRTAPDGPEPLAALTRAGLAHLYFESIHPFEDGNGRVGRAIAEKVLAQTLGSPTLTALASTILVHRASYYGALEAANKGIDVSGWLVWFAGITLEAQFRTQTAVEFLIDKTKLLDRCRDTLNPRQRRALVRMLREGPDGFKGGLSASNYVAIVKTSQATATRDLANMVEQGALVRTGERRYARYHLPIPIRPVPRITISDNGAVISSPVISRS